MRRDRNIGIGEIFPLVLVEGDWEEGFHGELIRS